jgi:plasmid maintenance system killer protein
MDFLTWGGYPDTLAPRRAMRVENPGVIYHVMDRGDRRELGVYKCLKDEWRICFRWEDQDAFDVEIVDYH